MALRESAALGVLAGEPHRMAFEQQRAERERLGGCPIDARARFDRLAAVVQETLEGPVQVETLRYRGDLRSDFFERRERSAGMAAARVVGVASRLDIGPAAVEPIGAVRLVALARFELGIELGAPIDSHLLDLALGDDVFADELVGVDLARGRVLADRLVHQRLGKRRLVALVVPEAPVAEHIDDDGTLEFLAELGCDLGCNTTASGSSP